MASQRKALGNEIRARLSRPERTAPVKGRRHSEQFWESSEDTTTSPPAGRMRRNRGTKLEEQQPCGLYGIYGYAKIFFINFIHIA